MRISLISLLGVALLAGCASSLPPAPPPPVAPAPLPPPLPPPVVTAVPDPDGLVVFARVKNLAAANKVVWGWAGLPEVDISELVKGVIDGAMHGKEGASVAAMVDVTQPIDMAVSFEAKLPPKGLVAAALALKSLDAAKSALSLSYELVPGDDGVIRLIRRAATSDATTKTDDDSRACELAPSAGKAAYRLICGDSGDALKSLGPYLARTTPRIDIPADVHLEARARPLASYGTLARLEAPKLITGIWGLSATTEPATLDLVNAVIGDFFDYVTDLDVMAYDGFIDPAAAKLTMRTTFRSQTSLMAELAAGHPERADVPPPSFLRLPEDVDFASFSRGLDDAEMRRARDLATAAAREQLVKYKMPAADARALTDAFKATIRPAGGLVAHGLAGDTSYWIFERDETSDAWGKGLTGLMTALARPGVGKWFAQTLSSGAKLPTWVSAPPIGGLPRGSTHNVLTVYVPAELTSKSLGAKATKAGAHDVTKATAIHVVVVPDGGRAWVGLSTEVSVLKAKLGAIASPPGGGSSLGDRAVPMGLAGFKETRMTSGAFLTIRAILALVRQSLPDADAGEGAKWDAVMKGLPAKGSTPMTLVSTSLAPTADNPGGTHLSEVTVPADAIRDAVWFAMQADSLK
jgi:hypothetical protein